MEFKRLGQELLYESKIVSLYKDVLQNPAGKVVEYDLIKHKAHGGAGVLLVDDEGFTYLVKQYRNSIDRVNLEIPAGGYSFEGESGEVCALREAKEETGFVPQKLIHVSNPVSAIGTFDERTDIYIGVDLKEGKTNYDEDEFIEVVRLSVDDAMKLIESGEIIDAKTVIALLAYQYYKNIL